VIPIDNKYHDKQNYYRYIKGGMHTLPPIP
jgi:hypothetical protein